MLPGPGLLSAVLLALQAPPKPLNVLLITADDLGIQVSAYGDRVVRTPHIDSLAASGVRFETAWVTQASCSPSRSSIFTGLFPHSTGQYGLTDIGLSLDSSLYRATIPALLKQAGYRTGLVGKLHVDPAVAFPFDYRPDGDWRRVRDVARMADRFLEENGAAPFFLMISYGDPHASADSRERKATGFPVQVDGLPEHPLAAGAETVFPFQGIDSPAERTRVANYYNAVLRLDAGVGMLLDRLTARGYAGNTLIIFLGDHGPPFERAKITTYEAGMRVPFIVRWPGVSMPSVSSALVSTVDILPTILDAAGIPAPGPMQGSSLRPLLGGGNPAWRQYLPGEFHLHADNSFYPRRAIRDHRYKLIDNLLSGQRKPHAGIDGDHAGRESRTARYDGTEVRRAFETLADPPPVELYDLQADPIEFHNLAGRPEYHAVQEELTRALMAWRVETRDPFLDPAFLKAMERRFTPWWKRDSIAALVGAPLLALMVWWVRARRRSRLA